MATSTPLAGVNSPARRSALLPSRVSSPLQRSTPVPGSSSSPARRGPSLSGGVGSPARVTVVVSSSSADSPARLGVPLPGGTASSPAGRGAPLPGSVSSPARRETRLQVELTSPLVSRSSHASQRAPPPPSHPDELDDTAEETVTVHSGSFVFSEKF